MYKRRIDELSAQEVAKKFVKISEQRRIYFGQFEWMIVSDWWIFDVYTTVPASVSVTYNRNSDVIIVFFECLEFCPHPLIPRLYSNPRAPPELACPPALVVSGASGSKTATKGMAKRATNQNGESQNGDKKRLYCARLASTYFVHWLWNHWRVVNCIISVWDASKSNICCNY